MINKQRYFLGFHSKHFQLYQFGNRSHHLNEWICWIRFRKSEGGPEATGMKMILEIEQTD